MTTGEITSSILAILALIISGTTAYLTFFAKFKAVFLVKRRVILTKILNVPHIVLECEFFNEGAKQGSIEDIILTITHNETGNEFKFLPQYAKDQYNIFAKYELKDFSNFSGVFLKPKDRKAIHIAFRSSLEKFSPPQDGTFSMYIVASDGATGYGMKAPNFSIPITRSMIERWINSEESSQVEALELAKSRQNFFGSRQR